MKMTRYSDPLILAILRRSEGGVPVAELCREHGMRHRLRENDLPDRFLILLIHRTARLARHHSGRFRGIIFPDDGPGVHQRKSG